MDDRTAKLIKYLAKERSIEGVAGYLGVSERTAYRLVRGLEDEAIDVVRVGWNPVLYSVR